MRSRAGTTETGARRRRVGARGRGARRRRDPAHVDRRRRHARRLRPRADRAASPTPSSLPVIASGGAGNAAARRRRARGRAGGAARLDPARGSRAARVAARRVARAGRAGARCADLRPAIVQDADDGPRADARVDERRGRAADPRDRRGVVLEPVARAALAQGRDLGQHARGRGAARRLRRRRAPAARATRPGRRATRASVSCFAPALWRTIARARSRAARGLVHDGAPRRGRRRVRAQGRRGGGRGSRSPRSTRATSAWSRRRPTSSTTSTCCSPRAGSTSRRSRTSSAAGPDRPAGARHGDVLGAGERGETPSVHDHVGVLPVAVRLAAPRRRTARGGRGSSGSRRARSRSAARCGSGCISQSVSRSDAAQLARVAEDRRVARARRARSRSRSS